MGSFSGTDVARAMGESHRDDRIEALEKRLSAVESAFIYLLENGIDKTAKELDVPPAPAQQEPR